jgi:hypothetical protein
MTQLPINQVICLRKVCTTVNGRGGTWLCWHVIKTSVSGSVRVPQKVRPVQHVWIRSTDFLYVGRTCSTESMASFSPQFLHKLHFRNIVRIFTTDLYIFKQLLLTGGKKFCVSLSREVKYKHVEFALGNLWTGLWVKLYNCLKNYQVDDVKYGQWVKTRL